MNRNIILNNKIKKIAFIIVVLFNAVSALNIQARTDKKSTQTSSNVTQHKPQTTHPKSKKLKNEFIKFYILNPAEQIYSHLSAPFIKTYNKFIANQNARSAAKGIAALGASAATIYGLNYGLNLWYESGNAKQVAEQGVQAHQKTHKEKAPITRPQDEPGICNEAKQQVAQAQRESPKEQEHLTREPEKQRIPALLVYDPARDREQVFQLFRDNKEFLAPFDRYPWEKIIDQLSPNPANPLDNGKLIVNVLRHNDILSGFIAYHMANATTGHILFLAVNTQQRGKGYGRQLIENGITRLQEIGATTITIFVYHSNARAIKLYTDIGFREIEDDRNRIGFMMRYNPNQPGV